MADEQTKPPFSEASLWWPEGLDYGQSLLARDRRRTRGPLPATLRDELGKRTGLRSASSFRRRRTGIQDPAKLRAVDTVDLIDRETWLTLDADVKGDAYEGLLETERART
jgi:type I restriction enzyme M protein